MIDHFNSVNDLIKTPQKIIIKTHAFMTEKDIEEITKDIESYQYLNRMIHSKTTKKYLHNKKETP